MNYQYRAHPTTKYIVYLLRYPYGFTVQVHIIGKPGYPVNQTFPTLEKAFPFYERMIKEYTEVYGK